MTTDTAPLRPSCDCIEDNAPLSARLRCLKGPHNIVSAACDAADALDALSARVADLEGENTRLKIECVSWKSLYERFAGHLRRAYSVALKAGGSPRHGEFDTAEAITDVVGSRDAAEARATQAEAERDALKAELSRLRDEADRQADEMTDRWHADQAALAEAQAAEIARLSNEHHAMLEGVEELHAALAALRVEGQALRSAARPIAAAYQAIQDTWMGKVADDVMLTWGNITAGQMRALVAALSPAQPAQGADPLDTPLPCEISLPGMRFGKGVSLRTFVQASARWKTLAAMVPLAEVAALEARASGPLETEGKNG